MIRWRQQQGLRGVLAVIRPAPERDRAGVAPPAAPARGDRPRPRQSRLTLRATLLTLVLGLLLVTIAALATVNYVSHARSLADLEARYFALASETVHARLQALLQPAAPTLDEAVYSAGVLETLPVGDDNAVADYGLARIRFGEGLTWFYYGDAATGRFVGARKEPDGTLVVARSAPQVDGGQRHEEIVAADGTRRPLASAVPAGFDPRERPWFRAAAGRAGIAWTGPYVLFTQRELGLTASRALRDAAGQLVGVFGVDLTIRDLRELLASLVEGSGGRAYLVDRGSGVVASSLDPDASGQYPVLATALAQAPTPLATLPLGVSQTFGFTYAGERWVAAIQAFPVQGDVQWATAYLVPDHAAQACRAALRAQERLAAMRDAWAAAGRPRFRTRIGLHTGEVPTSTFGTAERFAYTAIGDAMNLASRLEGLNKVYGTFIMGSEELRAAAGAGFEWRRLDLVVVMGRAGATPVYELLGETGRVPTEMLRASDEYEAALEAYFAGRFREAAEGFRAAAARQPQDRAAPLMAERAANFQVYSPGPDWHGVHVATHK